ncbi:MAG: hypothetical protein JKY87_06430 [Mariprofundus sp.]|nr:hypothetical protein [Mariprofundus sp.]
MADVCVVAQAQDMQRWLAHGPRGAIVESVTFSTASLADNTQDFFVRS